MIRHAPLWTRAFHSFNLLVLVVMAGSGLQIYNANPVFGGRDGPTIPAPFTLGGWLAGGRDWHFGFMGLYALNLGVWIALLIARRGRRLAGTGDLACLGDPTSPPPRRRLSLHRAVYTLLLILLACSLLSGMAMYKPAQLWWLSGLFRFAEVFGIGSWQALRVVHFLTVPVCLLLILLHAALSWRIGGLRLWRSIFT